MLLITAKYVNLWILREGLLYFHLWNLVMKMQYVKGHTILLARMQSLHLDYSDAL